MTQSNSLDLLLAEAEQQSKEFGTDSAEVIQHLRDLGYLNNLPINILSKDQSLIKAIADFESDFMESGILSSKQIEATKAMYDDAFAEEMLRILMDLDEGIPIKYMPEFGEMSLTTRVIHYRLNIYGLFQYSAKNAFGFSSSLGLQTLRQYLGLNSNLEAINLLANKEGVLKRILSIYGNQRCMMFLYLDKADFSRLDFKPDKLRSARDFFQLLGQEYDFNANYLVGFKRDILAEKKSDVKWEYVRGRSSDDLTRFIIQVLQVHQWMDGFYEGKTDGEIGVMSLNSIASLLKFYNAEEDENVKLKSILYYIGDGYFVFNGLHLIKHYVIEDVPKNSEEDVIHSLTVQSGRLNEADQIKFEANLNSVLNSAKIELHDRKQKVRQGILKRAYFGIRAFFKKLFRIGKRLVKMILRHIKKIFSQLTDFFKRVLEYGKQALRSFIQGIKYIIGRLPIITASDSKVSISNSEFMGDTLSILYEGLSESELEKHQKKVLETQRSAQYSVAIVGEVLKLLKYMLKGFVGWPILILQLARATRTLYQQHQIIYQ